MIRSLERSCSVRKPSASSAPRSPVCSQPPRSACALASGLLPVAAHHARRGRSTSPISPAGSGAVVASATRTSTTRLRQADGARGARDGADAPTSAMRASQRGDRHRALALAVDLREPRPNVASARSQVRARTSGRRHRRSSSGRRRRAAGARRARPGAAPSSARRTGARRRWRSQSPSISAGSKPPDCRHDLRGAPRATCGRM